MKKKLRPIVFAAFIVCLIVGATGCAPLLPGTWKNPDSSSFLFVDNAPDKEPLKPVGATYAPVWQAAIAAGAAVFEPVAGAVAFLGMGWLQGMQNWATVRGQVVHVTVGVPCEVEAKWRDSGSIESVKMTPSSGREKD